MLRFSVVAGVVFLAAPAFAQEAPLEKVYACASIAASVRRLSCFDAPAAVLKQADTFGNLAVVDRAQIEKAEKEAFGLATPSLSALAESARSTATSTPKAAPTEKPKALEQV